MSYICVECGRALQNDSSLYIDYGEGTLRLTHCDLCFQVADKYIEYELVLVCVDIVLHRIQG